MKRLEDFPIKADINKNPLYKVFSEVTFSELKTFDLMRLLNSFRRHNQDLFEYPYHYIGSEEYIKEFITNSPHLYKTTEEKLLAIEILTGWDWATEQDSHKKRMKYYLALKKELSKREHLTPHEKRSVYKCS